MSIEWRPGPPPAARIPYLPLRRLNTGATWKLCFTCKSPIAVICHFFTGRTLPCVGDKCPGCRAERRQIRECYASATLAGKNEHIIIVLPPGAERQLYDALPSPINARGVMAQLHRNGNKSNGRISVVLEDLHYPPERLPPEPDIEAHLYQIWGLTPEQFGSDHPLWDVRESLREELIKRNGARVPPEH